MLGKYREFWLRALRRESRLQVPEQEEERRGRVILTVMDRGGQPDFLAPPGEALRHNADEGSRCVIQREGLTQNAGISGETLLPQLVAFHTGKAKLRAAEQRDGHYLLRSNLTSEDPAVLWTRYVQLTQIENVFRPLKSELGIRPIYHQLEHRADAHVLIDFLV